MLHVGATSGNTSRIRIAVKKYVDSLRAVDSCDSGSVPISILHKSAAAGNELLSLIAERSGEAMEELEAAVR